MFFVALPDIQISRNALDRKEPNANIWSIWSVLETHYSPSFNWHTEMEIIQLFMPTFAEWLMCKKRDKLLVG